MKFGNSTKLLFKQSKFYALAMAIALVSCKGEEGEIGPKGETGAAGAIGAQGPTGPSATQAFENGFIKGTLKGVRNDGTPFEEPFEYKLASVPEGFEQISSSLHNLSLYRTQGMVDDDMNFANMELSITNKDQNPTVGFNGFEVWYNKMLANKNLFLLKAGAGFVAKSTTLPISRAQNATYKLIENGLDFTYRYNSTLGKQFYMVKDTDGNQIFFNDDVTWDAVKEENYGSFSHIINVQGEKVSTSSKWGSIRLYATNGTLIFRTSTGTDLSETLNIAADTQEITNFVYNASTGLITFNYKIVVNELRSLDQTYYHDEEYNYSYDGENTTNHTLEITGSVSANIYTGIVMRKGFE